MGQLSYYISFLGGLRAVHLLFVLPCTLRCHLPTRVFFIIFFASVIIATFKPKTQQPLATTSELPAKPKPTRAALAQEMLFDLFLMRLSFIVDIFSHTFVTLFPAPETKIHALSMQGSSYSQIMFVAASSLSSFGSGVVPAVRSLALCVLQSRS